VHKSADRHFRENGRIGTDPLFPKTLMPHPVNKVRRHQFPKAQYKVKNWSEYDQALQERGSLTLWVTPAVIAA
jgi:hypothetical protein